MRLDWFYNGSVVDPAGPAGLPVEDTPMPRSLITKLTLGSGVFFLLIGLLATMMITNILTNRAVVTHLSNHLMTETRAISAFHQGITGAMLETQTFLRAQDTDSRDEARRHLEEARTALDTIATLNGAVDANDFDFRFLADKQQLHQRRETLLISITTEVTRLITAVEQGDAPAINTAVAALEASEATAQTLETDTERLTETITTTVQTDLERRYQRSILIAPAGLLLIAGIILGGLIWLRRRIGQLRPLATPAQAVAQGDFTQHVPTVGDDEISTLQAAFNRMVQDLRTQQAVLHTQTQDLQASVHRQQRLLDTVSQLSTPLLPVAAGVVVLPIVGHVDAQRAEAIMDTLLQGVAAQRARVAILDITGIAVVDQQVLHVLVQAMRGIGLLGAKAVVAGISSPMAQSIVEHGIDIGTMASFADLRTAIEAASRIP
jgi:anti-anti-sigma regulatory factor/HAMP domain-containing protein